MPIKIKGKKYWSEEEVNKLIESLSNATKEILHFKETGIPRCIICKKNYVNAIDSITKTISPYLWEPTCDCIKNKNLRLSIG